VTTSTDELTIAGPLVRYLRRALRRKLGVRLDILRVGLEDQPTPHLTSDEIAEAVGQWDRALASFNEGCELLALIGLTDDPVQADVEIDLRRWGRLALGALEVEYREGLGRKRDAEADGFNPDLIARDATALGELVQEIQKRTGIRPKRGRPMTFLEEQLAKRRTVGRRRGDDP
jgi:hypothetical protein